MASDSTPTRPRAILAANLIRLMDAAKARGKGPTSIKKVWMASQAANGSLTNGKVGRIAAASHTTDIDTLADLATVFKLEPWQLLVEGLDPANLPRLTDTPLLQEIRSLVSQVDGKAPQTGEAEGEKKLANPGDERRIPYGRTAKVGSALKRAIKVSTTGNKPNEGSKPKPVPKSRSRR